MSLVVVADASPIRYLVLIRQIELLQQLFGKIFMPLVVCNELKHPSAPAVVSEWMRSPPGWLDVAPTTGRLDPELDTLDDGERAAINLALSIHANLILIDDRKGAAAALKKDLEATGTLGILDLAAQRGLLDLPAALLALTSTNFRYQQTMIDALLDQHKK